MRARRPLVLLLVLTLLSLSRASASAQIVRVSVSSSEAQANGHSFSPSISASGRFVAFVSQATNLVPDDTNAVTDVFVRDRDTDADAVFDEPGNVSTTRVSVGPGGVQSDGASFWPGGFFDYYEGHVSGGATVTGSHWLLAEGETDGPQAAQTFVLIANTTASATSDSVRVLFEDQPPSTAVVIPIPANSRVTVPVGTLSAQASGRRHAIDVLESGSTVTGGLVVEAAMYGSVPGTLWSSGSGWPATRVP